MPRLGELVDPAVRFLKRIDFAPSGCWLWKSRVDKDGYGIFELNTPGERKQRYVRAHRFAFSIAHRRWPEGLLLHSCDVPRCVNPEHLSEGTQAKNMADCAARGRTAKNPRPGELNGAAKTTAFEVLEWRQRRAAGESIAAIARDARRPYATVNSAVNGETWSHL